MILERLPRNRYELGLVSGPEGLLRQYAESIPDLNRVWLPSFERKIHPAKDFRTLVALYLLFRKERPDIVHTHSSKAGILGRWAAWLAGVPTVFHTAHGFGFNDTQGRLTYALYIWLERLTSSITTRYVVVSNANAERAEKAGILKPGNWLLCRDSVPVHEFLEASRMQAEPMAWRTGLDRTIVGMVACFKPQKAPEDFVDVATRVLAERKDVHFVMVGDGDLRPAVESRIREHGIQEHVTLLGWQRNMPEIYRNLDIFVLTSLWEGQPCVLSEAMASRLPIVATDADGAREAIIDGETGFVCRRRDVEAIAERVLQLAADPKLRRSMGEAGLRRAHEFDIETSVARLESAYRECLRDNSTVAAPIETYDQT